MVRTAYKFYPDTGYYVTITGSKGNQTCITMYCSHCPEEQKWKSDCTDLDFDSVVIHYEATEK